VMSPGIALRATPPLESQALVPYELILAFHSHAIFARGMGKRTGDKIAGVTGPAPHAPVHPPPSPASA
jgi:hypothetical protein